MDIERAPLSFAWIRTVGSKKRRRTRWSKAGRKWDMPAGMAHHVPLPEEGKREEITVSTYRFQL